MTHIDIVFDGPPSAESGRFVEVEDAEGRSISIGEWVDRGDGTWALRITSRHASRPAPVAPPTEEVDPLGPKSPDDCTHWKVGRSFGSTHGVCHSCGSQIEYDEVSPLSIIEVKQPVVPVDALGFPTQEGATFRAVVRGLHAHRKFTVRENSRAFRYMDAEGDCWLGGDLDHTSIEDVRPADGRNGQ